MRGRRGYAYAKQSEYGNGLYDGGNDRQASQDNTTRYSSLTECLMAAKASPIWGNNAGRDWQGGTFKECEQWALNGWQEGARIASDKSARIVDRLVQSQSGMALTDTLAYDVTGGVYDVGGYLSGTPECWIRSEPQIAKRAISILVNVTASGGVESSTLQTRGIAVASLVLALQAKGHPVTVDVCQVITSSCDYVTRTTVIRVIDASTGSQLDVDRLVYSVAHPTVFRCIGRAEMTKDAARYEWNGNPESNTYPPGDYDLKLGGAHLYEVDRWRDGGEAWILSEFEKQTSL
jgi:hypothetical protein